MLQMLTLEEWAAERYRSKPPSLNTLRRCAKEGHFARPHVRKVSYGASEKMLS